MVIIGALVNICCSQRKRTGVGGLAGWGGDSVFYPAEGQGYVLVSEIYQERGRSTGKNTSLKFRTK